LVNKRHYYFLPDSIPGVGGGSKEDDGISKEEQVSPLSFCLSLNLTLLFEEAFLFVRLNKKDFAKRPYVKQKKNVATNTKSKKKTEKF